MKKKAARMVVSYIRVSTREQAQSKLSLINQKEKINAWALSQDLKVDRVYDDAAESAKNLNRPAVQEMLKAVEAGKIRHIIIYKLDRLIRNVENLGGLLRLLERKKVTLAAVQESLDTSSASGRLVVYMIGVIAQWERETISERTQVALAVKRRKGEHLGGIVPYGFRKKGKMLIPHPKEQPVLRAILKARKGGRGYQDISKALQEKKIRPRKGKRWYASTVRSICLRAGLPAQKGISA